MTPLTNLTPNEQFEHSDDSQFMFISEKTKNLHLQWIDDVCSICQDLEQQSDGRIPKLEHLKFVLLQIRDRIIGNSCFKYFFMCNGLLKALLPILWIKDESNACFTELIIECQREALTLVSILIGLNCSLDWTDLSSSEIFLNLISLLQGNDLQSFAKNAKFFEILIWSISNFAKNIPSIRNAPFENSILPIFIHLLDPKVSNPQVSQNVALMLASSCDSQSKQKMLIDVNIITILTNMLNDICEIDELNRFAILDFKILDGVIDLLGALTKDNIEICLRLSSTDHLVLDNRISTLLFRLLTISSLSTELKLKISLLIIHLYRLRTIKTYINEVHYVLGFLVSLVDSVDEFSLRAVHLLGTFISCTGLIHLLIAFLINDDETLQNKMIQMNGLNLLLKMLAKSKEMDSVFYSKRLESVFLVTLELSSTNEEVRKTIVDSKLLQLIIEALSTENSALKIAACRCVRNLSRSVKNLRTSLFDAGISKPLIRLLLDASTDVQITACATLCNMVLEFTPLKKVIVNEGGITNLVRLISHSDPALSLNATWSLKNLLYHSEVEIRNKILSVLTFDIILKSLNEKDELIQEQTLNLVRNIGCGRPEHIEEVFRGFGNGRFISILEMKLQASSPQIILQVLYIIVNVATGNELHKSRIMESSILVQSILNYLGHRSEKIRLAAVWSLINLTWPNEPGFIERVSFFNQMGTLEILKSLQNDPDYDVRQKINCAISNFTAAQ